MSTGKIANGCLSFLFSLTLFNIADIYRHRYPCADCFQRHGFPLTYRHDGGFAGGAAIVWPGLIGDLIILFALTILVFWIWTKATSRKRSVTA